MKPRVFLLNYTPSLFYFLFLNMVWLNCPTTCDLPASEGAGIAVMCHHAWPHKRFIVLPFEEETTECSIPLHYKKNNIKLISPNELGSLGNYFVVLGI